MNDTATPNRRYADGGIVSNDAPSAIADAKAQSAPNTTRGKPEPVSVLTGEAAWLVFRQAESIFNIGRYQGVLLRQVHPEYSREIGVFSAHTGKLVIFQPGAFVELALGHGINVDDAEVR